jgi:hypothetical protein
VAAGSGGESSRGTSPGAPARPPADAFHLAAAPFATTLCGLTYEHGSALMPPDGMPMCRDCRTLAEQRGLWP